MQELASTVEGFIKQSFITDRGLFRTSRAPEPSLVVGGARWGFPEWRLSSYNDWEETSTASSPESASSELSSKAKLTRLCLTNG